MKNHALAMGFGIVCSFLPKVSTAATFSDIYVFGDSFVDSGNLYEAVGFPPPPYYEGRFSNGPVWVEYLPEKLGINDNPDSNFAYAGATSGEDHFDIPSLPGLLKQVDLFQASNQAIDPKALFVISVGANDYSEENLINEEPAVINAQLGQTANNIASAVEELNTAGAQNFLIVNLPDYAKIPLNRYLVPNSQLSELTALTATQNQLLAQSLQALNLPDSDLFQFDIDIPFEAIISNPQEYGFANVTEPCLNQELGTICSNPNKYLFWDPAHPSATAHRLLADFAVAQLPVERTPEASPIVGILGVLGAVLTWKRRKSNA